MFYYKTDKYYSVGARSDVKDESRFLCIRIIYFLKFVVFTLFILSPSSILQAQEQKQISYFKHLAYKEGLPENDVKAFCADEQNGYWFRTAGHIVYYNGHDFINFSRQNSLFPLSSDAVHAMSFFKGQLFVFGSGGIDVINCKTKQSVNVFNDTLGLDIRGGMVTSQGRIVLISANGNIYQYHAKKMRKIGFLQYFTDNAIVETSEGHILVSNYQKEINVYDAGLQILKKHVFSKATMITGGVYAYPSFGTVVVLERSSLRYNAEKRDFEPFDNAPLFKRLFMATERYFYFVAGFNRIIQQDRHTAQSFYLTLNIKNNYYVNAIAIDAKQNILLCTNQGIILYKEPDASFSVLPDLDMQSQDASVVRRALVETDDHKIIQVNYRSIDIFNPANGTTRRLTDANLFGYAAVLTGHNLWLGTDGAGIMQVDIRTSEYRSSSFMKEVGEGKTMHVTALCKLNDTLLLLGASVASGTLKTYNTYKDQYADVYIKGLRDSKLRDKVTAIIRGEDSTWWICTQKGVLQINHRFELLRHLNKTHLATDAVNYLYLQNQSTLWLATDAGVIVFDLKTNRVIKTFTITAGLPNNKCLTLLPDVYETLWIPTYNGLARIHIKSHRIQNYYMQDGLPDNEYNYSSFLKARNGDIYLGGLDGYLRITPFEFNLSKQPKTFISVDYAMMHSKQGERLLDLNREKQIRLHASDDRLKIVFSLKDHVYAERINYEYVLEGLGSKWIPLNGQNHLELDYFPPGKYNLRIRPVGYNAMMSRSEITLPLIVYNYWFESKYFYLFIVLLMTGLLVALFNYRYNALRNLGKVKTGLANDIHDEIGTILTKAILKLELLRTKVHSNNAEIRSIEKNIREAVTSFRNILWSLNTDNRTLDDFIGRINIMLSQTFEQTHFHYLVTNHSPNVYFNKSIRVKRNLLLIIKELAHNALKHSRGNLFEVIVWSDGNTWFLLIVDNGPDYQEISENGLGLKSIAERVQSLNGSFEIRKKTIGFFITITL